MKRKLKAFTLVEMIIVMGILGILMGALMNFFRPIRQTFVDSTMLDSMRTTETGILEYLAESTKYAEKMAIYDDGAIVSDYGVTVNSPKDAYDAFCAENLITKVGDLNRIHIIVLNRSCGYSETGKYLGPRNSTGSYGGRIITNIDRSKESTPVNTAATFTEAKGARTTSDTGDTYMALGGAYYGKANFAMFIDQEKTWEYDSASSKWVYKGITFVVQTNMTDETGVVKAGESNKYEGTSISAESDGSITMTTTQKVYTLNLQDGFPYYMRGGRVLPGDMAAANAAGSISATGSISGAKDNTYIVLLEPDEVR